jgi:arylsulfatase A-like enzyme
MTRVLPDGKTARLTNLEGGKPGEHLTDRLTDEAERFVTKHRDRPFFLFLSHFAPHTAMGDRLQAPESLVAKFKKKVNPKDPQHDPAYAAMLPSLDDGVGRLLKKLDDLGLAENTLVIFTSDNGGLDPKTSNFPLRGDKGTPYEGRLRVPALVRWPGRVNPRSVSDTPVISPDVYPTVPEAAGVKAGPRQVVDGLSLVPLLTGAAPRSARVCTGTSRTATSAPTAWCARAISSSSSSWATAAASCTTCARTRGRRLASPTECRRSSAACAGTWRGGGSPWGRKCRRDCPTVRRRRSANR